ncbi:FMN-binding domain-containing protein [Agromyces flavus]|nr:hypothetical protein GCM10010932_28050 [Agromyces flavus]SDR78411.1 FMN-binding domain-containing protein [Agromyces flavus]
MILASAASAAALLGGWQLGNAATKATLPDTTASSGSDSGSDSGSIAAGGSGSTSSSGAISGGTSGTDSTQSTGSGGSATSADSTTSSGGSDGTYTGTTVSTRFGDVQVQVTISGGAITDVTALQLTDHDGRSIQISNRAEPVLQDEVLQAQSTSVAMVSGATYTSAAYLQSLQAALDQAGF